jgi:hypothetical protein
MKIKAISFKTAFAIVLLLHVLGFFAAVQLSSIRSKLARIEWKERLEKRDELKSRDDIWPTAGKAHTVTPVTAIAPKRTTEPSTVAKPSPTPRKRVAVTVPQKTPIRPTSHTTPNTIYSSTTEYKNGKVTSRTIQSQRIVGIDTPFTIRSSRTSRSIQVIPVY